MQQRVGVAVHESPSGLFAAEDQRHPQRPVLSGQAADRALLPLDTDEHREVGGRVHLLEVEIAVSAAGKKPSRASMVALEVSGPCLVGPPVGGMSVKSGASSTSSK